MTNLLPELKPCFYCNAEVPTICINRTFNNHIIIECLECNYRSSNQFKGTHQTNAIEAHNFIVEAIEEKIRKRMDRNDRFEPRR